MGLNPNLNSLKLNIELAALNVKAETEEKARGDGMNILSSFTNIKKVSQLVINSDIEFSRDAGRYYCNEQLYCSLYELMKHELIIPCVFLHLPPVREEDGAYGGNEELDKVIELVEEVIKATYVL
jgi:pyrrolidone-carboxylate peptidase